MKRVYSFILVIAAHGFLPAKSPMAPYCIKGNTSCAGSSNNIKWSTGPGFKLIDFSEEKSLWQYNRLRACKGKSKKCTAVIDTPGYRNMDGWIFINVYPVDIAETTVDRCVVKKQLSR